MSFRDIAAMTYGDHHWLCSSRRVRCLEVQTCEVMVRNGFLMMVAVGTLLAPSQANAQTITAYKTGEVSSGMTKQCIYDGLGSTYTRTISSVALCPLSIQVSRPSPTTDNQIRPPSGGSITAYKSGEVVTGMTKQCIYDGLGNTYTRTISSVALCPLTIQVSR